MSLKRARDVKGSPGNREEISFASSAEHTG